MSWREDILWLNSYFLNMIKASGADDLGVACDTFHLSAELAERVRDSNLGQVQVWASAQQSVMALTPSFSQQITLPVDDLTPRLVGPSGGRIAIAGAAAPTVGQPTVLWLNTHFLSLIKAAATEDLGVACVRFHLAAELAERIRDANPGQIQVWAAAPQSIMAITPAFGQQILSPTDDALTRSIGLLTGLCVLTDQTTGKKPVSVRRI
jgi:hypothetical protein